MRTLLGAAALGVAAVSACYVGPIEDEPRTTASPTDPSGAVDDGGASGERGAAAVTATGLPCDVAEVLATRCASCHGAPLTAPMPLLTYEDLRAPAKSDPSKTVAEVVVLRMKDDARPMPPAGPRVAQGAIASFEAWVAGGAPRVACDAGTSQVTPPPPPPPQPVVCTSGRTWSGRSGPLMNPGRACITCHEQEEDDGPVVHIGGTVYPTFREPDMCIGVDGTQTPAEVVVTDATGRVITMPVNASGNFSLRATQAPVVFPIRAKVVSGGKERAMTAAQSTGDCNSCHTATGANGAPGRIALP